MKDLPMKLLPGFITLLFTASLLAQSPAPRHVTLLDSDWRTVAADTGSTNCDGYELPAFDDRAWLTVNVPYNWDDYGGAHGLVHGNRHGTAWYRRTFEIPAAEQYRQVFLFFEGVGSYATVWVNGKLAGQHAGGRTTFTLNVTTLVKLGATNLIAVRADHPAGIQDLPWVCGGCSPANGFSEGSQPMGIFRPVQLVTTETVRIEPFGVHVWNNATATRTAAVVHVETEIRNYAATVRAVVLETVVHDPKGKIISRLQDARTVQPGETLTLRQDTTALKNVALWSPENPQRFTLETLVRENERTLDRVETPFGIRVIHWPSTNAAEGQFTLNGRPVFINGTCEYEHLLGASHAFGEEQVRARVRQIEAAGFNALRDAHQPHNLRYQEYWDHDGILWWPQFGAHIWFDTPPFRRNFKTLLRDWVRERRNSPSLVLWGLENESALPEDFARECAALIRELDPTASEQRLITTCNGGQGSDWNVPQNWTGTYGGDPLKYADDLRRAKLVGEYGAWRSLGLHTEGGYTKDGPRSEERFAALLETKIQLAESVRDASCGQFNWLLATHDNPGRKIGTGPGGKPSPHHEQGADGWDELDRIGPANNKGLLTLWGEPTDAYYLYRANYAPAATDPMVMIVSHTWPDRWNEPGTKTNLIVYSNCEEVELFNDYQHTSLGRRTRGGRGTHFQWDNVDARYNVLYAEGRVGGKVVATDAIVLNHLPAAPHRAELNGKDTRLTAPAAGMNYLYRVNCGGADYADTLGNRWLADHDFTPGDLWGSRSWAAAYDDVPPRFGSQRETSEVIKGTRDEALFQSYRFGREQLRYYFAVPDGEYRVELFFAEPWYGRGGGDCTGWRLFGVAVNNETKIRDLDLWREAGYARALKKVIYAKSRNGWLEISFPRVASYQAVISAIAIATADKLAKVPVVAPAPPTLVTLPAQLVSKNEAMPKEIAPEIYPATAARVSGASLENNRALLTAAGAAVSWAIEAGLGGAHELQVRLANHSAAPLLVELKVTAPDGTVADARQWQLDPKSAMTSSGPESGLNFNAGKYTVTFTLKSAGSLEVKSLSVK